MEECSGQREQHNMKSPLSRALCIYLCVGGLVGDGFQEFGLYVSYHHETFWPMACSLQATSRSPHLKIEADDSTTHISEPSIQNP